MQMRLVSESVGPNSASKWLVQTEEHLAYPIAELKCVINLADRSKAKVFRKD